MPLVATQARVPPAALLLVALARTSARYMSGLPLRCSFHLHLPSIVNVIGLQLHANYQGVELKL